MFAIQYVVFFFQAEDGIRDIGVTGVQTCALPIWKENMEEFVSAVLSPAKVNGVELLEDGETARVLVDESQLSLAIGKSGQNARLAAKLTGMRVDIKVANSELED